MDELNFNEKILNEGLKRYGANLKDSKKMLSKQNIVYSFYKNGEEYIIRFSNSSKRTKQAIESELNWINFLADNKIPVSRPIFSDNGNLIEVIELIDSIFLAVAFEIAKGTYIPKELRNNNLFKNMGMFTGKMHYLSKIYRPAKEFSVRPKWYNSNMLDYIGMNIPKTEVKIYNEFFNTLDKLNRLTCNRDSYGIIHSDIHFRNFNVFNDVITYFDFDDCEYGWFMKDISTQLFYTYIENFNSNNKSNDIINFIESFFEGYHKENSLDRSWILELPTFLKLREIIMYAMLYNWREFKSCSTWVKKFMIDRKFRIENKVPLIDEVDFSNIYKNMIKF